MKICFITTGDIKDIATSKRAFGLANPLTNLGWEVHLLLEDSPENHNRAKLECNDSVKLHYFSKGNVVDELKQKNKFLKSIQPDYVYICAFVFRNIVRCSVAKKLVEHSELQSQIPDLKGLKKVLAKTLEKWSNFYSDGVLCASKYLETYFSKGNKANKVMYFPYAFSQSLYKVMPVDTLEEKFQKYTDRKNFVYLGTVTNNYGANLMVESFKKLSETRSDTRLIILGKGRHYDETLKFVNDNNLHDCIDMPGFVDEEDIEKYFSLAEAFISPMQDTIQDWARCPSKLYMYLPYKKPVFTCKIGEPFEVLKDSGYYFETGDVGSLTSQINTYLSGDKLLTTVNPDDHTWETRSVELNTWIKQL